MKFKKGDEVMVTVGKDRGKKGKIETVLQKQNEVLVSGLNMFKRHMKAKSEGKAGGIIDIFKPLALAKIALICPKCGKQTRIGYIKDKDESKSRICRKCQGVIS